MDVIPNNIGIQYHLAKAMIPMLEAEVNCKSDGNPIYKIGNRVGGEAEREVCGKSGQASNTDSILTMYYD